MNDNGKYLKSMDGLSLFSVDNSVILFYKYLNCVNSPSICCFQQSVLKPIVL